MSHPAFQINKLVNKLTWLQREGERGEIRRDSPHLLVHFLDDHNGQTWTDLKSGQGASSKSPMRLAEG